MLSQIAGKQAGYRAMAEFHQSLVCKSNKTIGEEIARLEVIPILSKIIYFINVFIVIDNTLIFPACRGVV